MNEEKATAIALFGTGDKAALLTGLGIVLAVVAGAAGVLVAFGTIPYAELDPKVDAQAHEKRKQRDRNQFNAPTRNSPAAAAYQADGQTHATAKMIRNERSASQRMTSHQSKIVMFSPAFCLMEPNSSSSIGIVR